MLLTAFVNNVLNAYELSFSDHRRVRSLVADATVHSLTIIEWIVKDTEKAARQIGRPPW